MQSYLSNISTFLAGTTSAEVELRADAGQAEYCTRCLVLFLEISQYKKWGLCEATEACDEIGVHCSATICNDYMISSK